MGCHFVIRERYSVDQFFMAQVKLLRCKCWRPVGHVTKVSANAAGKVWSGRRGVNVLVSGPRDSAVHMRMRGGETRQHREMAAGWVEAQRLLMIMKLAHGATHLPTPMTYPFDT